MNGNDKINEQLVLEIKRLRTQLYAYESNRFQDQLQKDPPEANNEAWQTLISLIDDFFIITDHQGRILHYNPAVEKRLGYPKDESTSLTIFNFYSGEHEEETWSLIHAAVAGKISFNSIPLRSKEGKLLPVETKISSGKWQGEEALFCIFHDITRLKRAEIEINMLSHALRCISECLLVFDLDGMIIFANETFLKTYGYGKNELIGKSIEIIHSARNPVNQIQRSVSESLTGGWQGELIDRRKDGSEFTSFLSTSAVHDDSGRPLVIIGVSRDITERKQLEDQLRQSQKMEAIGQLAGGIAHDFNNLLTVIDGYIELLYSRIDEISPHQNWVNQIRKASERAGSLTRQLLAFSRRQILQPKPLDLNQLVKEMSILLKRLIGEDVELTTELNPDIGQIKADPSQIEQVLMNLAVNARDAMPEGGQLTIATKKVHLDGEYAKYHPGLKPGVYVLLSIGDTGIGMSREVQARIFEPFFTTKEKGKGTGLGLATVYGIVKQSGGHIGVDSEIGVGTTFKICLPSIECERLTPPDIENDESDITGKETILVVEDEFMVRELVCDTLRNYGYTVIEAANGKNARQVFEQYQGRIDLVLTDVIMPEMSGRKLIELLSLNNTELKALFMSGYTDEAIINHGVLEPGMAFIQKPFTPTVLAKKVRETLRNGQV